MAQARSSRHFGPKARTKTAAYAKEAAAAYRKTGAKAKTATGKAGYAKTKASGFRGVETASERTMQLAGLASYLQVYRASPSERIAMVKGGIRATEAKRIIADLAIGQSTTLKALNLSTATVNKKARQETTLSPAESERVLGIARLVGQVEAMLEESGNPEGFDAKGWISRWLQEPLSALGGVRPIDLIDTMEGQNLVSMTLAQIEGGAYA